METEVEIETLEPACIHDLVVEVIRNKYSNPDWQRPEQVGKEPRTKIFAGNLILVPNETFLFVEERSEESKDYIDELNCHVKSTKFDKV